MQPDDPTPTPPMPYSPAYPPGPAQMPGTVRAARAIIVGVAAIGLFVTVYQGVVIDPYFAGRDTAMYFLFWVLAVLACFFGRPGNGIRITATVLAVLQLLCGLGMINASNQMIRAEDDMLRVGPGVLAGPLNLVAALAVIVLLWLGPSSRWFLREQQPW